LFINDVLIVSNTKKGYDKLVKEILNRMKKNDLIQKFLGLVNYYKRFVKDFTKIAKLLYIIVEKNIRNEIRKKGDKSRSRSIRFCDKRYVINKIYDKEKLAIVRCLKVWRYFLKEAK